MDNNWLLYVASPHHAAHCTCRVFLPGRLLPRPATHAYHQPFILPVGLFRTTLTWLKWDGLVATSGQLDDSLDMVHIRYTRYYRGLVLLPTTDFLFIRFVAATRYTPHTDYCYLHGFRTIHTRHHGAHQFTRTWCLSLFAHLVVLGHYC